jgi:hypothetical protein
LGRKEEEVEGRKERRKEEKLDYQAAIRRS